MIETMQPGGPSIDAVITWVDGGSADHRRRRTYYISTAGVALHENAVNPHRWVGSDEIFYCLRSIAHHAPWIRTIWIVVDGAGPDLSRVSAELRTKIRLVDHREIFAGFEEALPTFNSLAIESLIWRIEGLAERFLYFNDDVFLTAPLSPDDVFRGTSPILRGKWVDRSALEASSAACRDPSLFNHFMQLNAARLIGADPARLFAAAHVVHPLRRSVMASLFAGYPDAFAANIGHRFRDLGQFLPQCLHNLACIAAGEAVLSTTLDHLHIRSGQGTDRPASDTSDLLETVLLGRIRFLCVNDLPQLERLVPDARRTIDAAVGGT